MYGHKISNLEEFSQMQKNFLIRKFNIVLNPLNKNSYIAIVSSKTFLLQTFSQQESSNKRW